MIVRFSDTVIILQHVILNGLNNNLLSSSWHYSSTILTPACYSIATVPPLPEPQHAKHGFLTLLLSPPFFSPHLEYCNPR